MSAPILNFEEKNYTDNFIKSLYENHWTIFRLRNLNAAKIFHDVLGFKSVIDFGCSIGTYLEYFLNAGCDVKGFEYCFEECTKQIEKVENLSPFISFGDVSKEIQLDRTYELSLSTEVAEHIPEERSDFLADNLCNSSEKYIIFTAAKKGQGGTGHINCQDPEYWIEKFKQRGWDLNQSLIDKIKSHMVPSREVGDNTYPNVWSFIYDNLMVFSKNDIN